MQSTRVCAAFGAVAFTAAALSSLGAPAYASAATPLRAFSASVSQSCTVAGSSSNLDIVISGQAPASVAPGATFAVTGMSFSVGFSASETSLAALFGVSSASATVSELQFSATHATPAVVNVLKGGSVLSSGSIPVLGGQPATVRMPGTGTFAARGFKAPASGTMTLTAGTIVASLTAGPWLNGSPLSCQRSSTPLTTIPVS